MTDNRNTARNSYPIPTISMFAKSLKIPETKPLNLHLSSYLVNPQWQHKFIIILLVADLLHLVGPISTMDAQASNNPTKAAVLYGVLGAIYVVIFTLALDPQVVIKK